MKHNILLVLIIIATLSCLICVNAEDLNTTDLSLNPTDAENLEVAIEDGELSSQNTNEDLLTGQTESDSNSKAYLIIDNDADKENIYIGDYVTWIVSVINKGPDTAKNVKVNDELPDGLKYVEHTTTKGTYDPLTGIWDIGDLSIDDGEVFLNILTKAFSSGEKVNKAKVTSDSDNINENESYEEEIDVFNHEVKAINEKSVDSNHPTGNPL